MERRKGESGQPPLSTLPSRLRLREALLGRRHRDWELRVVGSPALRRRVHAPDPGPDSRLTCRRMAPRSAFARLRMTAQSLVSSFRLPISFIPAPLSPPLRKHGLHPSRQSRRQYAQV